MKITNLQYTERKTLAQYEFAELTAHAVVEDGEDATAASSELKAFVHNSLHEKIAEVKKEKLFSVPGGPDGEIVLTESELKKIELEKNQVKEEKPKRGRKSKVEETVVEETPKEEPKKKSKVTLYSADNKHVLQSYLNTKYGEAWKNCKPRNEIVEFTSKLPGQEFLDEEGNILPSFLEKIHGFFGNA